MTGFTMLRRSTALDAYLHPVGQIEDHTDEYFNKTAQIALSEGDCRVTYAVFLRSPIVVAVDLACEFIEKNYDGDDLVIHRIYPEGATVPSGKKILEITGMWSKLSAMETLFLQRIGWSCVAAREAYEMAIALPEVSFIDMHARHAAGADMVIGCSYGASIGSRTAVLSGAKGFIGTSTAIAAPFFGMQRGVGTMPHALVGFYAAKAKAEGRDPSAATLEATMAYVRVYPQERQVICLNDYMGQEITDGLSVARWFFEEGLDKQGKTLGFRLDTHGGRWLEGLDWEKSVAILKKWTHLGSPDEVIDRAIMGIPVRSFGARDPIETARKHLFDTGVTAAAIVAMRKALDDAGYKNVILVASSGFNVLKCQIMGNLRIPINVVGTGSFLPSRSSSTYATADITSYDGTVSVKAGREFLVTD